MRPTRFEPLVRRFERLGNRIVLGILAAALINGLAVLMSVYHPAGWEQWAGPVFATGFAFALALRAFLLWGIFRSSNPLDRYLFMNHGVAYAATARGSSNLLERHLFRKGAFIWKYVFPDGELVPVGDMLGIAERVGFEVRDVESLREHYALTLRHWVQRLEANREEALRQVGERTYHVWRIYMAGCSHAFATARVSVHQAVLSKPDEGGRSGLPISRTGIYA